MGVLPACSQQGTLTASGKHASEARFFLGLSGLPKNKEGHRRRAMRDGRKRSAGRAATWGMLLAWNCGGPALFLSSR